jgi:putative endonuclease
MNYSYVLVSERDRKFYIGSTGDLRDRLQKHNIGAVRSTAHKRPLRLIYFEACLGVDDTFRRERYLKSGRGGHGLRQRLACTLSDIRSKKLERC